MSKKILLLYFSPGHKAELTECENVFKAILRKFRKSALFSYMQIDTSHSCREAFKESLFKEINRHDAILLCGDKETRIEEEVLMKEVLCLSATEYHVAGYAICYPSSRFVSTSKDDCIVEKYTNRRTNLQRAAELSLNLARSRKHSISICTQAESDADRILFREFEYALGKAAHIQSEHISFDAMISLCMNTIPSFDVVITTEQAAKIIAMHLHTLQKLPSGYLLRHTENERIYCRQVSPHEEMSNASAASILMAFSAILENELTMKSAGDWLRRSISLAFEQYAYAPRSKFLNRVIFEINKPIRQRSKA